LHSDIIVGTNLPTQWARNKRAFVVNIMPRLSTAATTEQPTPTDDTDARVPLVRPPSATTGSMEPGLDRDGCWNFNPSPASVGSVDDGNEFVDHRSPWYSDPRPLMEGCRCWTCRTHSRAYLYHLVCSKELLAELLFFMHNLHHMLTIVQQVNKLHAQNDADSVRKLCQYIESQLGLS
jgi:Queuine tRNA-ribosyltransferase